MFEAAKDSGYEPVQPDSASQTPSARILFEGKRATGVEFVHNGTLSRVKASSEVVMSMGAVQMPKLLLQSGVGDQEQLNSFVKREVMPGALTGKALEELVRDAAVTVWHQSGTAKMGRDSLAVVDGRLRVYGIENLRIADASIMLRVTTRKHNGLLSGDQRASWRGK